LFVVRFALIVWFGGFLGGVGSVTSPVGCVVVLGFDPLWFMFLSLWVSVSEEVFLVWVCGSLVWFCKSM